MAVPRWKRWLRWSLGILATIFVALQFVPVERTNPPVVSDLQAPAEIAEILRRSCYDCHSYETRWPWYTYVAPVSWWITEHVNHGRSEMNFSEWPVFDFEEIEYEVREIEEQIEGDKMPLSSYLILHRSARLSAEEKQALLEWARSQY